MKKKEGAVLVWVLAVFTVIILVGTFLYSFAINTGKLNIITRENVTLESVSKSGLSIGEEYLINDNGYKKLTINSKEEVNREYIKNNIDLYSNKLNNDSLKNYNINIVIYEKEKNLYLIESTATYKGNKNTQYSQVKLDIKNGEVVGENINNFIDNIAGITIFKSSDFKIYNSAYTFNYSNINIPGTKWQSGEEVVYNASIGSSVSPFYIENLRNNDKIKPSKGLKLGFQHGVMNFKNEYKTEYIPRGYMLLFSEDDYEMYNYIIPISSFKKSYMKYYTGAIIVFENGDSAIINNGNININNSSLNYSNCLIYSTGVIHIRNSTLDLYHCSLVADKGITISNSSVLQDYNIPKSFKDSRQLKHILQEIVEEN